MNSNRKNEIEKKNSRGVNSTHSKPSISTENIDQEIEEAVTSLRTSRFYREFKAVRSSMDLAREITEGKLSGGTDSVRSRALAWCVRISSSPKKLPEETEKYLVLAKDLKTCEETVIAEAFVSSRKEGKEKALSILSENGLDSPLSKSAAFMIVLHNEGEKEALNWLKTEDIDASRLDPEGKYFVLICLLNLASWNSARDFAYSFTDEDLNEAPALHCLAAVALLLRSVPEELRDTVREQPPFQESEFRLASDANTIHERRKAHEHFVKAMEAAGNLNFSATAKMCEEYAFWLEMSDPEKSEEGKKQLKERLRNPETALHLVRLAARFGIDFDPSAVEREIERQTDLNNNEATYEAARARLALVFTKENLKEVADYVDRHQKELKRFSDRKSFQLFKIKTFSEAGQYEKAKKCLAVLKKEGLSETEYENIGEMISESEQGDRVNVLKRRFEESESISDLIILVNELDAENKWVELCGYAQVLFEKTRSLRDAERLANAFSKTKQTLRLVEFGKANANLLENSRYLRTVYCWALHDEGLLLEACLEFKKLDYNPGDSGCRDLRLTLAVSVGDWKELSAFVADELLEKENRNAQELISVAQLAAQLGSEKTRELTLAAVEKGEEDPIVLTTAYFLASNTGWESDPEAQQWLEKAVSLSGEDGPVRLVSLKDFMAQEPHPYQPAINAKEKLISGEMPIFVVAWHLKKSLFDLTRLPALANPSEKDPRRKVAIPAYSGKKLPERIKTNGTVGIDATALITLDFLGLLDKSLDAFETLYIPHSTLSWLLDEKGKTGLHQISRVKDARKVHGMRELGMLEKLAANSVPDPGLSDRVGKGLAVLITEAEKPAKNGERQRIVIRSSPIYPVAAPAEKEADLSAHAGVLASCRSIVNKLREKGRISPEEEKKADDYLRNEKPWPGEPEIEDGAVLYLDEPSVTFFMNLGILDRLRPAGFRLTVSPETMSKTHALISHENTSLKIQNTIERIRVALNSRIKCGKIKIARKPDSDGPEEQSIYESPTAGTFAMENLCDAIIVDDMYVNRNARIGKTFVFSTLDVLETLVSSERITREKWLHCGTRLRRAGYFFVPLVTRELLHHLVSSKIRNDKLEETEALKAIRENILSVQMNNWRQLPEEWFWLEEASTSLSQALSGLWTENADVAEARMRSDWIIDRVNVPALVRAVGRETGTKSYEKKFGKYVLMMVISGEMVANQVKEEYWKWVEERILLPMEKQTPDLYSWVVNAYEEETERRTGRLYESVKQVNE